MQCDYFDHWACRSCTLMGVPYADQLIDKDRSVRTSLLDAMPLAQWAPPFASAESGFRNKAKLAVGGSARQPTLGIVDRDGAGIDLRECGLYEPALAESFGALARFVELADLTPYSVHQRRGELKFLIVTVSPRRELMVRFVLRSRALLAKLQSRLPLLRELIPRLKVASINLQPEHKAVLDGPVELPLTDEQYLCVDLNDVRLRIGPQSFLQTNTAVAAGLYAQSREWLGSLEHGVLWDLYCGVGGFALHAARPQVSVHGIEISADAVANAQQATPPGVDATFSVGDAYTAARSLPRPDTVIVNPPRRGIGDELCRLLEDQRPNTILYSSCNPATLRRDLLALPSYRASRARLFDMFPQTGHSEVLTLLTRS